MAPVDGLASAPRRPASPASPDAAAPLDGVFHAGDTLRRKNPPYLLIKLLDDQPSGGGRLKGSFEALEDGTVAVGSAAVRLVTGRQYSIQDIDTGLREQGAKAFHVLNRNNFHRV